jgi:hypothetical protein
MLGKYTHIMNSSFFIGFDWNCRAGRRAQRGRARLPERSRPWLDWVARASGRGNRSAGARPLRPRGEGMMIVVKPAAAGAGLPQPPAPMLRP